MTLEMPCLISKKEEVNEEDLKNATMVAEKVALVKKEFNQYIFE